MQNVEKTRRDRVKDDISFGMFHEHARDKDQRTAQIDNSWLIF